MKCERTSFTRHLLPCFPWVLMVSPMGCAVPLNAKIWPRMETMQRWRGDILLSSWVQFQVILSYKKKNQQQNSRQAMETNNREKVPQDHDVNASPAGEGRSTLFGHYSPWREITHFASCIHANRKQKFMNIHFMQNKCVSFLIFSQDNLGFAFRHSLSCKLKVPNDDCDCPLYFTLFVLPNIDWFPLSPECVTVSHRLLSNEEELATQLGRPTVLFCLVTHIYCAFRKSDFWA